MEMPLARLQVCQIRQNHPIQHPITTRRSIQNMALVGDFLGGRLKNSSRDVNFGRWSERRCLSSQTRQPGCRTQSVGSGTARKRLLNAVEVSGAYRTWRIEVLQADVASTWPETLQRREPNKRISGNRWRS